MRHLSELTQKELIELSDEQFESFVSFELMERGILPPIVPVKTPIKEMQIETKTFYQIQYGWTTLDLLFVDIGDAEAVLRAKPFVKQTIWPGQIEYARPIELEIKAIQVTDEVSAKRNSEIAAYNKKAEEENELADKEYEKARVASSEVREELRGLVVDAYRSKARAEKIKDTFESYIKLSNNNKLVAYNFLLKVFSSEECCEAAKWFPEMENIGSFD